MSKSTVQMENYSMECIEKKDETNIKKKKKKKETLNERRSKKKKACMKDFKEVTRNSYDFADRWGSDEVLL